MTLTYSGLITRASFVAEMQAHRAADHFVSGSYFNEGTGRGCAIGCGVETINSRLGLNLEHSNHSGLANALGWPVWLCKMEDRIFEELPDPERLDWPVNLAIAVPEGVSLEPALNQILARILREVVLPVAGGSTEIVRRVADGCATNWVGDDLKDAAAEAAAAASTWLAAANAAGITAANAAGITAANATTRAYANTTRATANAWLAAATTRAAAAAAAAATRATTRATTRAYANTWLAAYIAADAADAAAANAATNAWLAAAIIRANADNADTANANADAYDAANADARAITWRAIAQVVLDEVGRA